MKSISSSLVCRGLEIVLQHVMAPSNALKGWSSMIEFLEMERLPEVREKIIETRLDFLTSPILLNTPPKLNREEEEAKLRVAILPKLKDNFRYFDEIPMEHIDQTLPADIAEENWFPRLEPLEVFYKPCFVSIFRN
jgi:hypothetical protein